MKEIRDMPLEERHKLLNEMRTELSKLRTMINAGGSVENSGQMKSLRRTIARILTVIREEELER